MTETHTAAHDLNLTNHRDAKSVWDRRGWDGSSEQFAPARVLAGVGAGVLTICALRQRTWTGRLLVGLGAAIAWSTLWALTDDGPSNFKQSWGPWRRGANEPAQRGGDAVQDASADSFPASDAPSWTPTVGSGVR